MKGDKKDREEERRGEERGKERRQLVKREISHEHTPTAGMNIVSVPTSDSSL